MGYIILAIFAIALFFIGYIWGEESGYKRGRQVTLKAYDLDKYKVLSQMGKDEAKVTRSENPLIKRY